MTFLIVPNILTDAIYKKIDSFIEEHPDKEQDRKYLYRLLVNAYNEHGVIGDIEIEEEK